LKSEVSVDDATNSMFPEANDLKVKPVVEVLRASGPLTVNLGLTDKTLSDQGPGRRRREVRPSLRA
jgi:hypothetical protein